VKIDNFHEALARANELRDKFLRVIYDYVAGKNCYYFLDRRDDTALEVQTKFGIDTLIYSYDGALYAIEEKCMFRPDRSNQDHDCIFVEHQSNTQKGYEKRGWLWKCRAHYLVYGFEKLDGTFEAHVIELPFLRDFIMENVDYFNRCHSHQVQHTANKSRNWKIPFAMLHDPHVQIPTWRYKLDQDAKILSVWTKPMSAQARVALYASGLAEASALQQVPVGRLH
jgi:hypothetical protein